MKIYRFYVDKEWTQYFDIVQSSLFKDALKGNTLRIITISINIRNSIRNYYFH